MDLNKLHELWEKFGDIPITEDDEIDEKFLHFPIGTDRFDIWHWFEDQNPQFIIGDLL